MRKCDKSNECPWGCWMYENTCAVCDEGECKREIEEYECKEIEREMNNVK